MTDIERPRFGVVTSSRNPFPEIADRWREAEALGFDTIWVTDHFITGNEPPDDSKPIYEAWTLIAGLAMVTDRIRFGIMVTGNTYRNPALLAKEAITVDHISNGRLELGVGAGWWEREHHAYGYPFPGPRELVDRFQEALEMLDSLQTKERTDYRGAYYSMVDAPFEPKPLQKPRIPLLIGASGPRMLRLTAKHADVWNTRGSVEVADDRSRILDEKCREIDRDPNTLVRSIWPQQHPWEALDNVRHVVDGYGAVGFSDFVFTWPPDDAGLEVMRQFARDAMPELRG